jgi:hypothetical protein
MSSSTMSPPMPPQKYAIVWYFKDDGELLDYFLHEFPNLKTRKAFLNQIEKEPNMKIETRSYSQYSLVINRTYEQTGMLPTVIRHKSKSQP